MKEAAQPIRPDPPGQPAGSIGPPAAPARRLAAKVPRTVRAVEIVQTVLTGLVLAFIFRAFFVEPFIIPTGSMAPALLGAHATLTCPACGWEFDFAPLHTAAPATAAFVCPAEIVCPNCLLRLKPRPQQTLPKAGDRLLVHKWAYATGLLSPARWDVIVFRDPANPDQHYIKRLVGLPGEAVEIVDGDVFINDAVARKPPHVQRAMWSVIFDQAHLPALGTASGRVLRWITREAEAGAVPGWTDLDSRVFRYDGLDDNPRTLAFNADAGRDYLSDVNGYDHGSGGNLVGDLRLVGELTRAAGVGWVRFEIERPPDLFAAEIHADGRVRLLRESSDGASRVLGDGRVAALAAGRPVAVELAHLDYRVYLAIGGREVLASHGEDYAPDLAQARSRRGSQPVALRVRACNVSLELRGLRIDRDVYYTESGYSRRATAGRPFQLLADEYFVLGDNSLDSHDSREWTEVGPHLPRDYRAGTVRGDQIVGQAAFVYLPGLLPVDRGGRWAVPDVGRVRFVR